MLCETSLLLYPLLMKLMNRPPPHEPTIHTLAAAIWGRQQLLGQSAEPIGPLNWAAVEMVTEPLMNTHGFY